MDWAKAKTILIAVFLAINIFLGYIIIGQNAGNVSNVDSERVEQAIGYLAKKGIAVKGQVPKKKIALPSITVRHKLFKEEEVEGSMFAPGEKPVRTIEGSLVKLKGKTVEVSIRNNRELYYINTGIKPASDIDERECSKKIEEFLGRLGMKKDTRISRIDDLEGYKRFTYVQSFKETPIYNSKMEFYVNNDGVQRAEISWFETIKQVGRNTEVISPAVALLYLPEHNKKSTEPGREVSDIQQGYYFGTGASNQVDVSVVEEGTAFPVWKITTDRDIIYINAYNEKVEGIEKAGK